MPTLAAVSSPVSWGPAKARSETNSDIVKPIPANQLAP